MRIAWAASVSAMTCIAHDSRWETIQLRRLFCWIHVGFVVSNSRVFLMAGFLQVWLGLLLTTAPKVVWSTLGPLTPLKLPPCRLQPQGWLRWRPKNLSGRMALGPAGSCCSRLVALATPLLISSGLLEDPNAAWPTRFLCHHFAAALVRH